VRQADPHRDRSRPLGVASDHPRSDSQFLKAVLEKVHSFCQDMDWAKLKEGIKAVMEISSDYNKFMQDNEIWSASADPERRRVVLSILVSGIRLLAGL
jgi:methionyl-tRNA synthetase